MVKYTAPLFAVALLAVAANASYADYETRDIAEESQFSARELEVLNLVARELTDGEEFTARELEELELYTRSKAGKFFKGAFKVVKKVGGVLLRREQADSIKAREFDDELEAREFEDSEFEARDSEEFSSRELEVLNLVARELTDGEEFTARELEELELYTRNKAGNFFKKAFGVVKKVGGFLLRREQADSIKAREFDDELEAREFEDSEFEARDFEEFDAREIEELLELFAARELDFDDEMVERDLDFDDEMFERDYEVDELD